MEDNWRSERPIRDDDRSFDKKGSPCWGCFEDLY